MSRFLISVLMLMAVLLLQRSASGAMVSLSSSLTANGDVFTAYFAAGTSTDDLISFGILPECRLTGSSDVTTANIRLWNQNTDTSYSNLQASGVDVVFSDATLLPKHTGRYVCTAGASSQTVSMKSFDLHVVARPNITQPAAMSRAYFSATNNITCSGSGKPAPTASFGTLFAGAVVKGVRQTPGYASQVISFKGSDVVAAPGLTFRITCTVEIAPFTCTAVGTAAAKCMDVETARTQTVTTMITIVERCNSSISTQFDLPNGFSNEPGASVEVACRRGYTPSSPVTAMCTDDGRWRNLPTCTDVDECSTNACPSISTCTNTMGGYLCTCPTGYDITNNTCTDIDECSSNTNPCPGISTCSNTPGGYQCVCPPGPGYTTLNGACVDVDECSATPSPCASAVHVCSNTAGSYQCSCPPGWTATSSGSCIDVDECSARPGPCLPDRECINTVGAYRCACPPGSSVAANGTCHNRVVASPQWSSAVRHSVTRGLGALSPLLVLAALYL